MKNKTTKKRIIIAVAIVILCAVIGGIIFMFSNHYVSIRGQHLTSYRYSVGGGMTGGYYSETVQKSDSTHATVTIEKAEWHSDEPTVTVYQVDASVLDALEQVVRKNHMNFWNNKKFTNTFICDGESESYSFSFDENTINFSSQIYPAPYGNKIKQLNAVIKEYMQKGTLISE